jgi:tetratricopeptide (TPR) repeat protein
MPGALFASLDPEDAMKAYQEKRYAEALPLFLNLLSENPQSPAIHRYLALTLQEISRQERNRIQADRLDILGRASRRLESGRLDPAPIDAAILETTQAEQRQREERWQAWCEQAEVEIQMGHLFSAHDLVLKVLAENPRHVNAQRQLSDLQIHLRQALDEKTAAAPEERFAWEGFYAYGQADFDSAVAAWTKSLDIIRQSYDRTTALQHLAAL